MRLGLLLGCLLVCLPSCKSEGPEVRKDSPPPPITEADEKSATAFGKAIDRALKKGDLDFVMDAFDLEKLTLDAFKDVDLPARFERDMRSGLAQGKQRMRSQYEISRVDFVGYREVRKRPGLLFRIRVNDGLEYVEYQLEPADTTAGWIITDTYSHSMGTYATDMMRAIVLPALAQENKSLLGKIFSKKSEREYLEHLPKLAEVFRLAQSGDPEMARQARDIWERIPAEAKKSRFAGLVGIGVHSNFIEDADPNSPYMQAIARFEKKYPDDPALALMAIDASLLRSDFDGARKAVANLQKATGDASFLEFYLGFVDLLEEKFDDAETRARDYISSDPNDKQGYDVLLEAGFALEKHETTAEALTALESRFGMDFEGVLSAAEAGWVSFRNSDAGKKWIESR